MSFPNTILARAGVRLTNSRSRDARTLVEPKAGRMVNTIKERGMSHQSDSANYPNEPTSHTGHVFHLTCPTIVFGSNAWALRCTDTRKEVCDTCGVCGMSGSAVGVWASGWGLRTSRTAATSVRAGDDGRYYNTQMAACVRHTCACGQVKTGLGIGGIEQVRT